MEESKIDLNRLLIRPLYFGLLLNILIPVVLLAITYFLEKKDVMSGTFDPDTYSVLFWIFCVLAIVDGVLTFVIRQKLFFAPMVMTKETFEDDLMQGFFKNSIVCYAMAMAIAVYGFVLFFLGGSFETMVLFVLISMIAYQFIRPRFGFAEKVIAAQKKFVEEGRFFTGKK